jgi:hypothetical protein
MALLFHDRKVVPGHQIGILGEQTQSGARDVCANSGLQKAVQEAAVKQQQRALEPLCCSTRCARGFRTQRVRCNSGGTQHEHTLTKPLVSDAAARAAREVRARTQGCAAVTPTQTLRLL